MEAFETEHAALKRLPEERFVVPVWKRVTVNRGDQFVTFNKMYFSLPPEWRGQTLWACYRAPVLRLYSQERLVRQYVVRSGQRRYWKPQDFPPEAQHMMNGGYPAWLVEQAAARVDPALVEQQGRAPGARALLHRLVGCLPDSHDAP